MSYTDDEIGNVNQEREKLHAGEEQVCDDCGEGGVVGNSLASGSEISRPSPVLRSMFGSPPPRWYWIHETCAQERAPFHLTK